VQLDLFLDGREALLVDELVANLVIGRPRRAGLILDRLRDESPKHPDLGAFDLLVRALASGPPALGAGAPPDPLIGSFTVLVPVANRLLGISAPDFLRPWWQALVRTDASPAPTDSAPSLRYWMGSARWHVGEEREAVRLWLPLCWLDPASFARQAPTLPSPVVREAWNAFDLEADPNGDASGRHQDIPWFPAWLSLHHRWVAHVFRPWEVPETDAPLRALKLLPGLLVLESQGYSDALVRERRALRDISPGFFRTYQRLIMRLGPETREPHDVSAASPRG